MIDDPAAFALDRRELDGATALLAVRGELDLATAPELKWSLSDAFGEGHRRVVVDLSAVEFIDSTALGVLVGVQRSLPPGSTLALVCAGRKVLNIFELTGLDGAFEIFADQAAALAHLDAAQPRQVNG